MNVLIACEESQVVCSAFRSLGHNAFSCDIQECSGGHPEWHIKGDVTFLLNGNCDFFTMDKKVHKINSKWDMIIAFPPCTYLSCVGNAYFNVAKYGDKAIERNKLRLFAADFFLKFVNADCDKIAIENPVGFMNTFYREPDQIIHPYYFGDDYMKRTCLWLKGLPPLFCTDLLLHPEPVSFSSNGKPRHWVESVSSDRAKTRSKTFPGIAKAMANQWGGGIFFT